MRGDARAGLAALTLSVLLAAGCAHAPPLEAATSKAAPAAAPVAEPLAAPAATPEAAAPLATLCAELSDTFVPQAWLLLPAVDVRGRRPFRADTVFARHLLDPASRAPQEGESLTGETGEAQRWEARQAEPDGEVKGDFAWAYTTVMSPAPRVMLAESSGAGVLFVNGDGAAGDPYRSGYGLSPVALRAGVNHLYVAGVREGGFRLVLRKPEHALLLELADTTRPDLVAGGDGAGDASGDVAGDAAGIAPHGRSGELAVTVINASLVAVPQLIASTGGEGLFERVELTADELPPLPPLGVVKLPLRFALRGDAILPAPPASVALTVRVGGHPDEPARDASVQLDVRAPDAPRRVTRRSRIDDSVQEYALRAPAPAPASTTAAVSTPTAAHSASPGVVLSLHGAGVDALTQASSYSPKSGWWIVAPTNRRPFGFDWQDWGRLDAYETLEHALRLTGADATRVALTGHSMGGHGSWHLSVNDPDRFLAVAPSAGWSSFDSYPGRPAGALSELWHRADAASETFALLPNLVTTPVYVLHGSADDNVPASEGHALFDALTAAVAEAGGGEAGAAEAGGARAGAVAPQLHIQDSAGHWWDGDASPGADCVDWPPIFEMFDAAAAAAVPAHFEWTCADPGIDSSHHWLSVIRPLEYGRPVHITADWDAATRHIELTTQNAELIVLRWPDGRPPASTHIDGMPGTGGAELSGSREVRDVGDLLELRDGTWQVWPMDTQTAEDNGWNRAQKNPERSGPFKRAFDNRFVLVYGTAGDAREDAELLARARYDSEQWRYRGNGYAQLWSDREVLAPGELQRMAGRNVILYGNRDTNLAFQTVLPADCPLRAERGRLELGDEVWMGDDLAAVCVYPRAGDERALVGVFADTGPTGSRLGYTLAPFVSGVGYPDFAVFSASVLAEGDAGVRAAGWFDRTWRRP